MFAVRDTHHHPVTTLPFTPLPNTPARGVKRVLEDDNTPSDTNHQLSAYNTKITNQSPAEWRGKPARLFYAQNVETIEGDDLGLVNDSMAITETDSIDSMTQGTFDGAATRSGSPHRQVTCLSRAVAPATDSSKHSKPRLILKLSLRSRQLRVIEKNDGLKLPLSTFKFTFEMPIAPRPTLPLRNEASFRFIFAPPPKIMLRIKIPIDISLSIRMSKKLKLA
ncbi:hypothetical protein DL93DRAFT_2102111 [Clavulina sp. PMI_390]|nr:hypothetical protein DL93DRAFT_2102111 [Clavulina sp. PMI_390]